MTARSRLYSALPQPVQIAYLRAKTRLCPVGATKKFYRRTVGRELRLDAPVDLNEKVQWLKLYSDTTQWSVLADKYRVRDYVADCGLADMLPQLYGVWHHAADIDFAALPETFVMKLNNGSGDARIVRHKSTADLDGLRAHFAAGLRHPYGLYTVEPHYLKIDPRIMAEEFLDDRGGVSSSPIDYKIMCCHGEPQCVLVCYDRQGHELTKATYDMQWNAHMELTRNKPGRVIKDIARPGSLERMVEACRTLGRPFPFVRIDFYDIGGRPYFGEMTFTPAAGCTDYFTPELLDRLGSMIDLTQCKKRRWTT